MEDAMSTPIYLGDGVYASINDVGVRLSTPRDTGLHEIFLDGPTLDAFLDWLRSEGLIAAAPEED